MSYSFDELIESHQPKCVYCGQKAMTLAWKGTTPFNQPLAAFICGDCGSTFYLGSRADPVWQMLSQINQAFGKAFQERAEKRTQAKP